MSQSPQEQIKLTVEQALNKNQIPGAAIAIYINSQSFLETSIGYQDLNHEVFLPVDANFYIYSITKSLLATASLYLVSRGVLAIDTSVKTYLPDFPLNASITLRQLLSHTSGLPDYGAVSAYFDAVKATPSSPWSTETFLDFAQTQGLQFPPGKAWKYSNIGYLLLKCILEKVTGFSLQQLLHKVIFNPLSLQKTFIPSTLHDIRELTPGYSTFFNGDLQDVTRVYHPSWVAHGVVVSTAPELAKIIDALFTGKILNPLFVNQMLTPVHLLGKHSLFQLLGYGLGLFLDVESPYRMVGGHTGEGPGYSVAAFHFPKLADSRVTVVAFVNRDQHDSGLVLVDKMVDILNCSNYGKYL
ncbi:serine hydrolase [Iningainema tapete]|uniref:Beta-lactamase family protein n=1 Tax=Iningainema tapete BLCC-T55 TaxID=2748662 RepID=A0A8J7C9N2_9CYAN|nr:beta-lactamase family protein [Iningainema tapete BLCC-T55]